MHFLKSLRALAVALFVLAPVMAVQAESYRLQGYQDRRGTAAEWTAANPTLPAGQMGLETDTGRLKWGDGTTPWNSLGYFGAGSVPITDSASKYASTTVEGALAEIGTAARTFQTIALLKAGTARFDGEVVNVACYYTCTTPDGGGGLWKWDAASSASDNGGTVLAPDAGGLGRWKRAIDGKIVHAEWFGAISGQSAATINAAIDAAYAAFPSTPVLHQGVTAIARRSAITWTGANLNARMTVSGGLLFVAEYSNNKVGIFDLTDPDTPAHIVSFTTATAPRHVEVVGRYIFVAAHGASKIEVYDWSGFGSSPALVGTITTGANPKHFVIVGNEIFVVCAGTNKLEKHRFNLPVPGGTTGFTSQNLGDVAVSGTPLSVAHNGAGVLAVTGLDTANVQIIGSTSLNLISTTAIGGAGHPSCAWFNQTQLLCTDTTNDRLYSLDVSTLTPVVSNYVATSSNPEQIEIVGNRAYVPSLTDTGVAAYLDVIDLTDAQTPSLFRSIPLTVTGAGFAAYHSDGDRAVVYVSGHFTPFNIDTVQVPVAKSGRPPLDLSEVVAARVGSFATMHGLFGVVGLAYRTETGNYTLTANDTFVRLGSGGALTATLPDPATMRDGKIVIIKNVGASFNVTVSNAYTGYSGTLTPGQAVVLSATTYSGTSQWDAIANY